jgi:hypothetical protein
MRQNQWALSRTRQQQSAQLTKAKANLPIASFKRFNFFALIDISNNDVIFEYKYT